jgi:aconitate hydratase
MLPLNFEDPADYDRIPTDAKVDLKLTELAVGKPVTMTVHPKDGSAFDVKLTHTFNEPQLQWFRDGSALNSMARASKSA